MDNPAICAVDGCNKQARIRGWCNGHYRKWTRWGDPAGRIASHGAPLAFLYALVENDPGEACVIWPFARNGKKGKHRYGSGIRFNGKYTQPHRIACELANGPANPPTLVAAHSCHNGVGGCVNPRHLSWMTQKQNVHDHHAHKQALAELKERYG